MERSIRYATMAALLIAFAFSLYHASWLAPDPDGGPKLIAGKPATLPLGADGCIAAPPTARMWNSDFGSVLPADTRRLLLTSGSGADAIVIESEMRDDRLVLTRPLDAGCPRDQAAERTRMGGALSTLGKAGQFLRIASPAHGKRLLRVAAANPAATRVFFADRAADLDPIPGAPAFAIETARACANDYRRTGMWGGIPESCMSRGQDEDGTMLLTLDDLGIGLWGWPDRFLARMAENDIRVIVAADVTEGGITGLTKAEQFGDIASSYNGYIWIDDIERLAPALRR